MHLRELQEGGLRIKKTGFKFFREGVAVFCKNKISGKFSAIVQASKEIGLDQISFSCS